MAGLCEGGNEPPGSLKARKVKLFRIRVYGTCRAVRLLCTWRVQQRTKRMNPDLFIVTLQRNVCSCVILLKKTPEEMNRTEPYLCFGMENVKYPQLEGKKKTLLNSVYFTISSYGVINKSASADRRVSQSSEQSVFGSQSTSESSSLQVSLRGNKEVSLREHLEDRGSTCSGTASGRLGLDVQ
ncbi:hypothetical protein ANN_05219 [Periplaneta americana]|uniref:Uncharacterized protein n=1 Tax=Periplaneta americana TaxID=6978 RepID=A0ABQ8TAH5_PERAM|nr:hypothetical protein ANN_05219 [Periplaneta americana]